MSAITDTPRRLVGRFGIKTLAVAAIALVGSTTILVGRAALRSDPPGPSPAAVVEGGSPGTLVLVDDRSSRREEARGLSLISGHVPLSPDDRFRIGSITKTFVAVVVLQLVGEHRLRLDDTVERWLPGLVPGGRRITVRELLEHTSGLADYPNDSGFLRRTLAQPRRHWEPSELVRVAVAMEPVAGPGRRFIYASTNYILLGMIVERAAGTSLARQLRDRIFRPLGLQDTSFVGGTVRGRYAHGYAPASYDGIVGSLATARDRSSVGASWIWAAGAIVSSAPDLSHFLGALLEGRLLPPRLLELMRPARGARYGLGLAAFPTPCGRAIGHTGALLGTVSVALSTTDGRHRVVVMSNSFPLQPSAETALRRLIDSSFCGGS